MRVSRQAVAAFNSKGFIGYNDAFNLANGNGTYAERALLEHIAYQVNGFCYRKLSMQAVELWIAKNLQEAEEIMRRAQETVDRLSTPTHRPAAVL